MKKPEIRFRAYSDEWNDSLINEVALINPKADLPETFQYVDLESVVGTTMVSCREEHKATAPSRAQRLAKYGDVFYQTVRPYQKNNYFFNENKLNYVFSTGYAQLRPSIDGSFLFNALQNDSFVKEVLLNCTGTSYPAINSNELGKLRISYPKDKSEQKAIGFFFTELDSLIEGKRVKLDKLKKLKQAYLGKMFPKKGSRVPEVRFKGFSGDWDEKRLGDIAGFVYGGGTPRTSEQDYWNGDIPWLQSSDIMEDDIFNVLVRKRITQKAVRDSATRIVPKNSIAIVARVGVGKIALVTFDFATSQDFTSLSNLNIDELYAAICIKQLMLAISNEVQGTSIKGITKDELLKKVILVPKGRSEQCKIGAFFQNLDNLINLQQKELDKLANIKSACLSKMFA